MERSVSISEARARLPGLVRDAEGGTPVEITRGGRPVAFLVSVATYRQMHEGRPSFATALDELLEHFEMKEVGLEGGELQDLRDRGTGRVPLR